MPKGTIKKINWATLFSGDRMKGAYPSVLVAKFGKEALVAVCPNKQPRERTPRQKRVVVPFEYTMTLEQAIAVAGF
jgi:hypothetical protein